MDEMPNDQGRKEGFISDLLEILKNQPIQHWTSQTGYTTVLIYMAYSMIMIKAKLLFLIGGTWYVPTIYIEFLYNSKQC